MARPKLGYIEKLEREEFKKNIERAARVQKQQIDAEIKLKALARQAKAKAKQKYFIKGFTQQFKQIASAVPKQQIQPIVPQQQLQQPQRPLRKNFFEHGSEIEVYGDEGLTFFDSQKRSRGSNSTGSLFGLG